MQRSALVRDWRQVIQRWVAQERVIAPRAEQDVAYWTWAEALLPPARERWPTQLPTCQALQEFYRLCDGGSLAWFWWFPLSPSWWSEIASGSSPCAIGMRAGLCSIQRGNPQMQITGDDDARH